MSSSPWLNYLNTVPPSDGTKNAEADSSAGAWMLSEDLRAQLEAWTTVTFEDPSLQDTVGAFRREDGVGDLADSTKTKTDPSPYAKRPFGTLGHGSTAQLERGFNAFTPEGSFVHSSNNNNTSFIDGFAGLGALGVGVDGSNTLFADSLRLLAPSTTSTVIDASQSIGSDGHRAKKQRTLSSSASSASAVNTPVSSDTSSSLPNPNATAASKLTKQPPLLTKAAVLAAQAAELAAQKAVTPEEEAARLAELNRIAAEDDKRRRNTAASARFRVKKKQREHALEDTVRELNTKIDKLEKDLKFTEVENSFLRELVIRKVGLADLPVPKNGGENGRISGGQKGVTGVGTQGIQD